MANSIRAIARVEADIRRSVGAAEPGWEPEEDLARLMGVRGARGGNEIRSEPESEPEAKIEIAVETVALAKNPDVDRSRSVQEKPMSRLDELNKILRKLQSDSPGLEASALISEDGLMIASALTPDLDETRVAGMTATLLNLGTRAAVELARGEVKEVIIRGERGYAVMIDAGRGALLLALANESAKLGLIFFDMHEAIRGLKKVL